MESFGKVQEESIQKIENLFHVVLPEDYTKFLLDFKGGVIFNTEPGEVYLKDIAQFINIDVLYGIDTGKSECDIEYWTDINTLMIYLKTRLLLEIACNRDL